jgi:hypothetical protein
MVVNFRAHEISRVTHKLAQTLILIKKYTLENLLYIIIDMN